MRHRPDYTVSRKPIHGFTLIELLVVIAIIATLLAILTPTLRKAKEVAQNLVCRTNMKTMSLAFRLYASENEDIPPVKLAGPGTKRCLWIAQISDYFENVDEARYCPAAKWNPTAPIANIHTPEWFGSSTMHWYWGNSIGPGGNFIPEQGSYGFNAWFYCNQNVGDISGTMSQAEWDAKRWKTINANQSSNIPVFADCIFIGGGVDNGNICPDDLDLDRVIGAGYAGLYGNYPMDTFLMNRHRDRINVGFVDGHAEGVELKDLWSLKWHREFQTLGEQTREDGSPIYRTTGD